MKLISIVISLILYIFPSLSMAEVFDLKNVEIVKQKGFPTAVVKEYIANSPIKVKYSYSISHDNDEENAVYFSFQRGETYINEIIDYGVMIENINKTVLKNSIITSKPPTMYCTYEGVATILFKDITLYIPEVAGEALTSGTVLKVINASSPKRVCQ
ncbi:hypothetical protein [Acinetobacter tianfuensis]|jgi:hypothetical protein|uniref:Uncharacterized protein n=1 Tax=Acinetobacter tianfuensis TaxID=2419603 RepID=A0A3A8E1S5_9GAMM|nr:hypothetical protein [Acinetobacter tianfuensis]RKG29132.1 hypothetical protein D7V32_16355 [Acinetobacter tianfuensis]